MKKFLVIFLFIAFIAGLFYVVKKYFPNIVSNVIPVNKEVKQYLPLNSETISPFKLPVGYRLDIFADLKNDLPRVMVFDEYNNMIVSLTSKGKVIVLTDSDHDLKSDLRTDLLSGLNKPHGIAVNGNYLYVAESDGVSRYRYDSKNLTASERELLFSLPNGGRHFTRTIKIKDDKLYVSVGSSCDACIEENVFRSSILVSNTNGTDLRVFAKGLRNTVFFDFDPTGKMWGADMGRDMLGDNLPPDEINIIEEGKDYGWPYCYGDKIKDIKFSSDPNINCENTESPVYELPAHSAPLGFVFDKVGNVFLALHGSWNSTVPVGYKVIKVTTFAGGVSGTEDIVSGFSQGKKEVLGRPAGLVLDNDQRLYISDDKTGLIYLLSK